MVAGPDDTDLDANADSALQDESSDSSIYASANGSMHSVELPEPCRDSSASLSLDVTPDETLQTDNSTLVGPSSETVAHCDQPENSISEDNSNIFQVRSQEITASGEDTLGTPTPDPATAAKKPSFHDPSQSAIDDILVQSVESRNGNVSAEPSSHAARGIT